MDASGEPHPVGCLVLFLVLGGLFGFLLWPDGPNEETKSENVARTTKAQERLDPGDAALGAALDVLEVAAEALQNAVEPDLWDAYDASRRVSWARFVKATAIGSAGDYISPDVLAVAQQIDPLAPADFELWKTAMETEISAERALRELAPKEWSLYQAVEQAVSAEFTSFVGDESAVPIPPWYWLENR